MPSGERGQDQKVQELNINGAVAAGVEDTRGEIDLVELFYHLLERVKYIIAATVVGILAAGLITHFAITPLYESTSKLYVLNSNDSVVNLSDLQIGSYLASDYQEVFKTWEVNERVLTSLGLPYTYKRLQSMVTVSNPSGTRILYITVRNPDPTEAALIANEYADVVREYIADTMATEAPNILSTALKATSPVSPSMTRNLFLGALIGAIASVGIIVVLFMLDDKIRSADDITKYTGIPTLAVVPLVNNENIVRMNKAM